MRARREAAVGLGGARFRAPLDLPVLIPRVKKRSSPRDPRGVMRETIPSTANKGRCRAGRVRLCPLPTFSGRFRFSGRVTASCDADEKRGGFGANEFARKPDALFSPAPSVQNRPCFCFELRARADSPRFRGSLPLWGEATCGRSCGARCALRVAAPSGDRCAVGGYSMPRRCP